MITAKQYAEAKAIADAMTPAERERMRVRLSADAPHIDTGYILRVAAGDCRAVLAKAERYNELRRIAATDDAIDALAAIAAEIKDEVGAWG